MKKQIVQKIFRVVLYLRLSSDDGDNRESDSISNQRKYDQWLSEREIRVRCCKRICG